MSNIDKYFKDQLGGAEITPSAQVWERIQQSGAIGEGKKGVIVPLFLKVAVAAMITIGAFTVAWLWTSKTEVDAPAMAIELPNETVPPQNEEIKSNYLPIEENVQEQPQEENDTIQSKTNDINAPKVKSNQSAPPSEKKTLLNAPSKKNRGSSSIEKAVIEDQRSILASIELLPIELGQQPVSSIQNDIPYVSLRQGLGFAANPPQLKVQEIDENAWMYADAELPENKSEEDSTITEKLFQFAGEKLNIFADASGLSFRKLTRISEIEIIY